MARFSPDAAFAYQLGSRVAGTVPEAVALRLGATAARALAYRDKPRRMMVERHLRRIHGPGLTGRALDRAVDHAFANYARYWVESFRLNQLTTADLESRMSWQGIGHLEDSVEAGKGTIIALPHLGGWDLGGAWLCTVGYPLTVVVEPLDPPELFAWFTDFRRSLGMTVVPLGPDAGREVLRALRDNGVVCLLSDRDVGGGGIEVEFFGERTTLPAGAVTLSLRTGARILPTAIYYTRGRGQTGVVRPPLPVERTGHLRDDVRAGTQALAYEMEALIRKAPEQWHVMQPNWPSDHEFLERHRSDG